MDKYKIEGEYKKRGAIGESERFIRFVSARQSRDAYKMVRKNMYAHGKNNVHIKWIFIFLDNRWQLVDSRAWN